MKLSSFEKSIIKRIISGQPDAAFFYAVKDELEGRVSGAGVEYLQLNESVDEPYSRLFVKLRSGNDDDSLYQELRLVKENRKKFFLITSILAEAVSLIEFLASKHYVSLHPSAEAEEFHYEPLEDKTEYKDGAQFTHYEIDNELVLKFYKYSTSYVFCSERLVELQKHRFRTSEEKAVRAAWWGIGIAIAVGIISATAEIKSAWFSNSSPSNEEDPSPVWTEVLPVDSTSADSLEH